MPGYVFHSNPSSMAVQCLAGCWCHEREERRVAGREFVFSCGWCGADCVVWGEPVVSWWTQKYRVDDFECWNCGTTCTPHDPPWTEAD